MTSAPWTSVRATRPSVRLVPWLRAWRAGIVPYDDVATAVAGEDEHLVSDLPATWRDVPLSEALGALSRLHPDDIRLVLPVPGDPRGLPGPGPFGTAALHHGEGVVAGDLGLVPEVVRHTSGSGDVFEVTMWRCHPIADPGRGAAAVPHPAEAEAELAEAVTRTTEELSRLDVARWRPEMRDALAALRQPGDTVDLPAGYDPRARRLFARASVLDRMLTLAELDAPGGAVTSHEASRRGDALRPLAAACRRALVASCNAELRVTA